MKDLIAERLLAKVIGWSSEEVAAERPIVQALASYKYDEYQQYSAGSRFIESLALWLNQFQVVEERRAAYDFVKKKLIFCSAAELRHLVEMAYPDHIRPILLAAAGGAAGRFRPKAAVNSLDFRVRQRQCLFLGLSDGARIDSFRRANPELNHEQIWQTHELSSDRVDKLLSKLGEHLEDILHRSPTPDECRFRTLVLLDDFSASGTSYFSSPDSAPNGGKIFTFFSQVCGEHPAAKLIDPSDVEVITLLYLATKQAMVHLERASEATWGAKGIPCQIEAVQRLIDCASHSAPRVLRPRNHGSTPREGRNFRCSVWICELWVATCSTPQYPQQFNSALVFVRRPRVPWPIPSDPATSRNVMRETRNPFRLRRAENIDTDTTFLSLFEPGILDVIAESGLPETVQLIRSAAGGGKTSLLRLFTPSVLRRLYTRRVEDQDLFSRLKALGAIDDHGPKLLGVSLLCGRNYTGLEDLRLEPTVRTRLFLGLLNARIILAVLRSALAFQDLEYPADLERLTVRQPPEDSQRGPVEIEYPCSGAALYNWARGVEKTICRALDSFGPLRVTSLPGLDSLFALSLLQPHNLTISGRPVADRIVIMMDDIHMLTSGQRALLVERVIEARSKTGIWIAERFEALGTQELLASGSTTGRDRHDSVELEWYWRRRHERFEKHVMRVADRRVRASIDTELDAFRSCLEDSIDRAEYADTLERAITTIRNRIYERGLLVGRFQAWVAAQEQLAGTPHERAIAWRALEILIERRLRKPQRDLFDDFPIPPEELSREADSSVKNAAELFLAREFSLPYYFGADRVARLASLNIEQFLGLSGGVFEEVIAAELIRAETTVISAQRQHALMKMAAHSFWTDIPRKVRHGREVRAFLDSVGRFAKWYTYRPSAPNDPGVGGTAIRMSERHSLMNKDSLVRRPLHKRFADLLASALAHNYLVADLDYKCKGDTWMVLNLNRLLCVHFDLPLGYGLYKERPLDALCRWIEEPFVVPKQEELRSWT